jgi:hypothetical protein
MQAALAAQMVAVHLMTMKVSERCLRGYGCADPNLLGVAGKLARTFAMQTDTLAKLQGRETSRQKITVSYEKHEHLHMHRGEEEIGSQPQAAMEGRIVRNGGNDALPGSDAEEGPMPLASSEGHARVPDARRKRLRSAQGSR